MPGLALAVICAAIVLVPLAVWWLIHTSALLRVAGVDPQYVQTVPDRVRYTSMGAIVLLTATAATASLTVALSLVFTARDWPFYLPVGLLWGAIVLNFDRWIVSSIDYGPLTADAPVPSQRQQARSKAVHFTIRFIMAALVGLVISEPIVLAIFGPEISQQLAAQHVTDISQQTAQLNAASARQLAIINQPVAADQKALRAAARKAEQGAPDLPLRTDRAMPRPAARPGHPGARPWTADHAGLPDLAGRRPPAGQGSADGKQRGGAGAEAGDGAQPADGRQDHGSGQEDRRRQRPAGPRTGAGHAAAGRTLASCCGACCCGRH